MSFSKETPILFELCKTFPRFVPDKVETKLERHGDEYELAYSEWFTYMPSDIAKFIIPLTKKCWEKIFSFLNFRPIDQGIEITYKGKFENFKVGVQGFAVKEAILFVAQSQLDANEMIESLCSERANENLCGKPDPTMACNGIIIQPNTVREWDEKIERETREKVEKAKSTMKAYNIHLS